MSKLLFKDTEYTYSELLELYLKNKKHYQEGEIIDLETGEICNIKNIKENLSKPYINEIMNKKDVNYKLKTLNNSILEEKYKNKAITKDEMYKYLIALNQHALTPNYNYDKGYISLNLSNIPINITDSEYGKFHKMLAYSDVNNKNIIHSRNEENINKKHLTSILNYKDISHLNKFIRKLKGKNLLKEGKINNNKYIFINPLYAKNSNFILTNEILNLFYKDITNNIDMFLNNIYSVEVLELLKEYISEYEYKKLSFLLNPDKHYEVFCKPIKDIGIYLLYKDNEIIYIGKSKNIYNRVQQHKKDKEFNNVKCIVFEDEGLINLYEPYLIQKYKPIYNKDLLDNMNLELPEIKL